MFTPFKSKEQFGVGNLSKLEGVSNYGLWKVKFKNAIVVGIEN
jgi:hypothetical protein